MFFLFENSKLLTDLQQIEFQMNGASPVASQGNEKIRAVSCPAGSYISGTTCQICLAGLYSLSSDSQDTTYYGLLVDSGGAYPGLEGYYTYNSYIVGGLTTLKHVLFDHWCWRVTSSVSQKWQGVMCGTRSQLDSSVEFGGNFRYVIGVGIQIWSSSESSWLAQGSLKSTYCRVCMPGQYSSPGSSSCSNCPAGKYGAVAKNTVRGQQFLYAPAQQSNCSSCLAGTSSNMMGNAFADYFVISGAASSLFNDKYIPAGWSSNGFMVYQGLIGSVYGWLYYDDARIFLIFNRNLGDLGTSVAHLYIDFVYSRIWEYTGSTFQRPNMGKAVVGQCSACTPGSYSLSSAASCTTCPSGTFASSSSALTCSSCSTKCSTGQYISGCGGSAPGTCLQCSSYCPSGSYNSGCGGLSTGTCTLCSSLSSCPVGQYRSGCGGAQDQNCKNCTNKFEIQQCGGLHTFVSYYTGSGSFQGDCAWECVDNYYKSGETCRPCTSSACPVGMYRSSCTADSDGTCIPCSNLKEHSSFNTSGVPYNQDNCNWACNEHFYQIEHQGDCVSIDESYVCWPAWKECASCESPGTCPLGQYLSPCNQNENYACRPCPNSAGLGAKFVNGGSCETVCTDGYFKNGEICTPCSLNVTCLSSQMFVNCTPSYDATCSHCKQRTEYQTPSIEGTSSKSNKTGSESCRPCTIIPSTRIGFYLKECTPKEDSVEVPCTQGPLNSFYDSPGVNGMNNCSWGCSAGFEKTTLTSNHTDDSDSVCSPCQAGSYSLKGDTECKSCPAGTYSARIGSTSPDVCLPCIAGKYSANSHATAASACVACAIGTYQINQGSSVCTACPKDTYGNSTESSSADACWACRSDTSTRGLVGQQFETACICKEFFYRIRNETVQCQTCPLALKCDGTSNVVPVVNMSKFVQYQIGPNDYYRLKYCPSGHFYQDLETSVPEFGPSAEAFLAGQQCIPCDAGKECVNPPCVNCVLCLPGTFKPCPGTTNCLPCKQNTFEPNNGSLSCQQCAQGTTTKGQSGCVSSKQCVCDSTSYNLGNGCQVCPAGLTCFGNSTVVPKEIEVGTSTWKLNEDTDKYNLVFCPQGYYIAGSMYKPGQQECKPCSPGSDCAMPPCYDVCDSCKPGYYKAATQTSFEQIPRSKYNSLSQTYVRAWIDDPCASCPLNTYRSFEGGTEVGSCTVCPAKSTTQGLVNRISPTDCKCDKFYYQQAQTISSQDLQCADCPQGAVCLSDRSCALNKLGSDTFNIGDTHANLSCPNAEDVVYGTWWRGSLGEYRLVACPSGFTILSSNLSLTSDKCVICPVNTYLLQEATISTTQCRPCPSGAICPGGNVVMALEGYWRAPITRRTVSAAIFPCPLGVCGPNNTCLNNRTGLVSDDNDIVP
jgi:hypothetical protein